MIVTNRWQDWDWPECSAVITDPPYTAHVQSRLRSAKTNLKKGICRPVECGFDHLRDYSWVKVALERCNGWILAFCALEQLGQYQEALGKAWVRSGIWRKERAVPQFSGDRPGNTCEGIAIGWSGTGRKKWNGGGSHAFWQARPVDRGIHPTEKPLLLIVRLVELFSNLGDLVIDPFAGTGTTGVACARLGRRFAGCEVNSDYSVHANARIEAELANTTLSAVQRGQQGLFVGVK